METIRTENFESEVTRWIAGRIATAQEDGGIFRLSLCGGGTPGPVYRRLAEWEDIDWERVLLTFGDERAVGPEHEDSNYRMVKEALIDPARIPGSNVVRICGEMDPAEAAERCEGQLKKLAQIAGEAVFVHDLVLLGMGGDGHTASLFPGTEALHETERWVVPNFVPKFDSWRITMTYPLIAAAKEVAFLVNGAGKHAVAEEAIGGQNDHPAGRVRGEGVRWFIGG